jgi:hypothetical protein
MHLAWVTSAKTSPRTQSCSGRSAHGELPQQYRRLAHTKLDPPSERKGFIYYAPKTWRWRAAKCGLMLWDGKSKRTLNDILNLIATEKRTLVYFAPTRDFHVLASQADLQALLGHCQRRALDKLAPPGPVLIY